jgi:AcrR family transcriptional regulator
VSRTADHAQRRRQAIAGVRAVALAQGLGKVTIANAAAAAGVSVGLVQHYYASKDDLLAATFASVRQDILERVATATELAERRHDRIERMLLAGLEELLPLDRRRHEEAYLTAAFAGLALEREPLREHLRRSDSGLLGRVVTAIDNGKACGEVPPETDAATQGFLLLSLAEGLAARLLVHAGAQERAWARGALRQQAAHTFPGRCARERP